ncbi:LAME_0A06106g1_1 [Lachancea meyersii CBS 8951]|uniref:Mitochondrial distribution and morphology protein 10 n=1 Tax=Lachancea meyersii CBS 8951 TaxID=1266667 RepID=A0A1G4IQ90_9SACH|nr:LAME_0A06106g1_1 [Lachancea meyersii CBS 8951]
MIDYMQQVLRVFETCTGWNRDNSYENITATSENLLNFSIPEGLKCQISNSSTAHTFSTFELSNNTVINGSLAYLYCTGKGVGSSVSSSRTVQLQDAVETYRQIRPLYQNREARKGFEPCALWFGRMYYPSSTLEAMVVKRLSPETQLVAKCLSSLAHTSVLTLYWQRDSGKNFQEWVVSSNEALVGYRVLHNFVGSQSKLNTSLYNNSSLSLGAELWFGLLNTSPACSTTLRYCTHSANTGKPLTLTLSWNPLFGHVSSTYSVKTSSNATISTKFDFNLYSIESNLSFGCELWRRGASRAVPTENAFVQDAVRAPSAQKRPTDTKDMFYHLMAGSSNSQKLLDDLNVTFASSLHKINRERSIIQKFEKSLIDSNFTSVCRLSTSLRDKNLKVQWEGRYKGFLISAGTELANTPLDLPANMVDEPKTASFFKPAKFGVQLQFSM